jgi:hypothetical protein
MTNESNKQQIPSYYANGIGFAFSDNDCKIVFGKSEPADINKINDEVEVYMTHKTLKLLATSATVLLDQFEKTSGRKIEFDQARIDAFRKVLDDADDARTAATASSPPP